MDFTCVSTPIRPLWKKKEEKKCDCQKLVNLHLKNENVTQYVDSSFKEFHGKKAKKSKKKKKDLLGNEVKLLLYVNSLKTINDHKYSNLR